MESRLFCRLRGDRYLAVGIFAGEITWIYEKVVQVWGVGSNPYPVGYREAEAANGEWMVKEFGWHLPMLGKLGWDDWPARISVPLWLPMAGIAGWIALREMRWREKRAKSAEDGGSD